MIGSHTTFIQRTLPLIQHTTFESHLLFHIVRIGQTLCQHLRHIEPRKSGRLNPGLQVHPTLTIRFREVMERKIKGRYHTVTPFQRTFGIRNSPFVLFQQTDMHLSLFRQIR